MNAQLKVWHLLSAMAGFIIAVGTLIFNTGMTLAKTDSRVSSLEIWKNDFVQTYRVDMKEMSAKQDQIIKTQNDILILLQNKQDRR
jgi:hypothetical protein